MKLIQEGRSTQDVSGGFKADTTPAVNAGVSAESTSTQAGMSAMNRLRQFAGRGLELGTQEMVSNAKKKALTDVAEGKFSEYGLLEGHSVYDQAYNSSGETAYISQTNTEIQAQVKEIASKNKYSPEGFKKAWEKHAGEISKNSKKVSRYVDAVTADVAQKYGDAAYTKIAGTLATKQFELNKKENSSALAMYEEEFTTARIRGDEDAAQTALINRNQTLKSMLQNFQISERGIEASNKLFEKSVISAQVKSNFFTAMGQGKGAKFVMDFKKTARDNKNFDKFSDTEVNAFVQDMHKDCGQQGKHKRHMGERHRDNTHRRAHNSPEHN